mmetsp:Transcript_41838/g.98061  ORF Transcript_41838/g.98061 Transcript_41838/m.98061 type:complete len:377 (+) Transcript_41838:529-1659(+)
MDAAATEPASPALPETGVRTSPGDAVCKSSSVQRISPRLRRERTDDDIDSLSSPNLSDDDDVVAVLLCGGISCGKADSRDRKSGQCVKGRASSSPSSSNIKCCSARSSVSRGGSVSKYKEVAAPAADGDCSRGRIALHAAETTEGDGGTVRALEGITVWPCERKSAKISRTPAKSSAKEGRATGGPCSTTVETCTASRTEAATFSASPACCCSDKRAILSIASFELSIKACCSSNALVAKSTLGCLGSPCDKALASAAISILSDCAWLWACSKACICSNVWLCICANACICCDAASACDIKTPSTRASLSCSIATAGVQVSAESSLAGGVGSWAAVAALFKSSVMISAMTLRTVGLCNRRRGASSASVLCDGGDSL